MPVDLSQGLLIGFINRKIQQNLRFLQIFRQLLKFFDFIGKGCAFFQNGFGFFRIIPEPVSGDQLLKFSQAYFFGFQVKDSPAGLAVYPEVPLSFV